MKRSILLQLAVMSALVCNAQDFLKEYEAFRKQAVENYKSFRQECNIKYVQFLREAWNSYEMSAPRPMPLDDKPVPPRPYADEEKADPVELTPVDVTPVVVLPQPEPVEPVKEVPSHDEKFFFVDFYGTQCGVRLPASANMVLKNCTADGIADAWEQLCTTDRMDNAIHDCLEVRESHNLCDWAYLLFLDELTRKYCNDRNGATLLMTYLYCQSGYQIRVALDGPKLYMLYGSRHTIFNKKYFVIDGQDFYPFGDPSESLEACNAAFEGETPMSLHIDKEQMLGADLTDSRTIRSELYNEVGADVGVPRGLIEFYDSYPSSAIDGNPMTRWAMYANAPLAGKTKNLLYPALTDAIGSCREEEAANKLLNLIQTGLVYEYDEKVWGHDRAFFAEESLYYPYCDCEDRSILFSRLVRDLLGLDVALIYYPGHLAAAVCFNDDVNGDAVIIDGRKFVICDPTYIGAPVGTQMPGLDSGNTRAIVLQR